MAQYESESNPDRHTSRRPLRGRGLSRNSGSICRQRRPEQRMDISQGRPDVASVGSTEPILAATTPRVEHSEIRELPRTSRSSGQLNSVKLFPTYSIIVA